MIDTHSHVLPGIDDGAKSVDITLEMLKHAEQDGVKKIVATPHYCLEYAEAPYQQVKDLTVQINNLCKQEGINIEIYHGQEVFFSEDIIEDYKSGIIGTINDSKYMLIEFPVTKFPKETFELLYELQLKGIVPIIAHPERYNTFIEKPSEINKFIDEGYLFQLDSGSIEGVFGSKVKKTAEIFTNHNIYNFIGSDAHNTRSRCMGLSGAMKIIEKKTKTNKESFIESADKMLKNKDVIFDGMKISDKKGIFSFFK
ncbi:tyrosine-protein phosphatase [Inconstantimicrobium mannanitabidum]|uniref:Exopolysaccharide biosynthesis protein n=1 Tax=Inconstantimicrobium mannanitabidum TaxID=1604901 RepID=A0ACB5REB3_9CLOT|nr:CpsB/CapC family capsule biosynthesis tyrosine phosphatase [Clostridium sp. TW13]GKX67446.1 exopolysaccharide biosynthesis protein [Clostridium sp. TW13]